MRRPSGRSAWVLGLIAMTTAAVFVSACSSSKSAAPSSSTTTRTIPAPAGLSAFYAVPDPLPAGQPGQIIRAERIAVTGVHGSVWRVMYHSRSVRGRDVPVTGFMVVPSTPPPNNGYPVVSWAHGFTGIADICTPSARLDNPAAVSQQGWGDTLSVADTNQMLDRGYLVARTDYEGLGTPGRSPYLVGDSEARGVIDIVRAARNMPQVHAGDRYVVVGHSSGGEGALFAPHIGDSWAPELHLLGSVAEAPPSQLENLATALGSNGNFEVLAAGAGFNAAYGDQRAPLDAALTREAYRFLPTSTGSAEANSTTKPRRSIRRRCSRPTRPRSPHGTSCCDKTTPANSRSRVRNLSSSSTAPRTSWYRRSPASCSSTSTARSNKTRPVGSTRESITPTSSTCHCRTR